MADSNGDMNLGRRQSELDKGGIGYGVYDLRVHAKV